MESFMKYLIDNQHLVRGYIKGEYGDDLKNKEGNITASSIKNFAKKRMQKDDSLEEELKKYSTSNDLSSAGAYRRTEDFMNGDELGTLKSLLLVTTLFDYSLPKNEAENIAKIQENVVYYIGYYPSSNYRVTYLWLELNYTHNTAKLFYSKDLREKKEEPTYQGIIEKTSPIELLTLKKRNTNEVATVMYSPTDGRDSIIKALWLKLHHKVVISSIEVLLFKEENENLKYSFFKEDIPKQMHILGGRRINIDLRSYTSMDRIINPSLKAIYSLFEGYYIGIFPYFNNRLNFVKLKIKFNDRKDAMVEYIDGFTELKGYVRFVNENIMICHLPDNSLYGEELNKGENEKNLKFQIDHFSDFEIIKGVFSEVIRGNKIWANKIVLIKTTETEYNDFTQKPALIDDESTYPGLVRNNTELINYFKQNA